MANVPGLDYGFKPVHDPTKRNSVLRFETNQPQRSSWFSRGGSGIIGSVISAGAGLLDSALNRRYAKRADKLNYERYLEERRYNSPAAAAARMRAAGLDPRAVTGQIASAAAASGVPQFDDPGTGGSIASGGLAAAQNLVAAGQMDIDSMRQAVEAERSATENLLTKKTIDEVVQRINNLSVQGDILSIQKRVDSIMFDIRYAPPTFHFDGQTNRVVAVTGGTERVKAYIENLRNSVDYVKALFYETAFRGIKHDDLIKRYENDIFVDFLTSSTLAMIGENTGHTPTTIQLSNAIEDYVSKNRVNLYADENRIIQYIGTALDYFGKLFNLFGK